MSDKKLVRIELHPDLLEAIEEMARDNSRRTSNMIEVALLWAVWSHSQGKNPDAEMTSQPGGYSCWDKKIKKRREVAELEKLFSLEGPERGATNQ